ncbi:MAG: hypothetical protein QGG40_16440 [Myxococcota bacterium]|jgi:hypothetical protein|nr:hypothetical protein [Myxococcota bacterium]
MKVPRVVGRIRRECLDPVEDLGDLELAVECWRVARQLRLANRRARDESSPGHVIRLLEELAWRLTEDIQVVARTGQGDIEIPLMASAEDAEA